MHTVGWITVYSSTSSEGASGVRPCGQPPSALCTAAFSLLRLVVNPNNLVPDLAAGRSGAATSRRVTAAAASARTAPACPWSPGAPSTAAARSVWSWMRTAGCAASWVTLGSNAGKSVQHVGWGRLEMDSSRSKIAMTSGKAERDRHKTSG